MATILVIYGSLEDSDKAIKRALLLMNSLDELVVLGIIPPKTTFLEKKAQKRSEKELGIQINHIVDKVKRLGYIARGLVKSGDAPHQIIAVAKKYKCNLIVIGIGKQGGLHSTGYSIAERVLELSHKPVLTVG